MAQDLEEGAIRFLKQIIRLGPAQIDREHFLRSELAKRGIERAQIQRAVDTDVLQANIPRAVLDDIARTCIDEETRRSSTASFATSFGGYAVMLVSVPGDLIQYYVHAFRIMQKLAYLNGWPALVTSKTDITDETVSQFAILLGTMLGTKGSQHVLRSYLTQTAATDLGERAAQRVVTGALGTGVVKQTLRKVGVNLSQRTATRTVAKAVPVLGGIVTGALTYSSLRSQAKRLDAALRDTIESMTVSEKDIEIMTEQLGREPRGVLAVAYRTPNGQPAVVKTAPRLEDGTPFPTLYYLTDPRLTAEASRLEVAQVMKRMEARLAESEELQAEYRAAHEHYLAQRNAIEDLGTDFSGGGMPDRVKCLHVLIAYALAEGPGRVRFGDEAVALAAEHAGLRGTAIPEDWPTLDELGLSLADAGEELA